LRFGFWSEVHTKMRIDVDNKLRPDYFVENLVFHEKYFHRRFRISTVLFTHICRMCEAS
jgi:hypothetical protein